MLVYLLFSISPVLVEVVCGRPTYYDEDGCLQKRKKYYVICGLIIFLVIALRSQYLGSADSSHYYARWQRYSMMGLEQFLIDFSTSSLEKGYLLFTWFFSHILPNPQFTFVTSGALFAFAVSRFIYHNSEEPTISYVMFICLGLFVFMIQGMRQAFAMSICLLSLEACKQRKFFVFLIYILFATLFHQTAICFFIVYFLYGGQFYSRKTFFTLLLCVGMVALADRIISTANSIFDREYSMMAAGNGFVAVAIYILIALIGFLTIIKCDFNNVDLTFYWKMLVFAMILYLMRYFAAHAAQRISFYFMFAQMIVLPGAMKIFDSRSQKLLKVAIIVLSSFLFIYRLRNEGFIPFYFFWQQ